MIIQVQQHHIDQGKPSDPFSCPVARAVAEATGRKTRVYFSGIAVCERFWPFSSFFKPKEYRLPESVRTFMIKFDLYGKTTVKPFSFELREEK